MTVTLNLNSEIEQKLLAQAQRRAASLDSFLAEIVSQQARVPTPSTVTSATTLKRPALHLGAVGSLHRSDIYDDVR